MVKQQRGYSHSFSIDTLKFLVQLALGVFIILSPFEVCRAQAVKLKYDSTYTAKFVVIDSSLKRLVITTEELRNLVGDANDNIGNLNTKLDTVVNFIRPMDESTPLNTNRKRDQIVLLFASIGLFVAVLSLAANSTKGALFLAMTTRIPILKIPVIKLSVVFAVIGIIAALIENILAIWYHIPGPNWLYFAGHISLLSLFLMSFVAIIIELGEMISGGVSPANSNHKNILPDSHDSSNLENENQLPPRPNAEE